MINNDVLNAHFALAQTQKKEILYAEKDGKSFVSEYEYGHLLIEFYDTNCALFENILSILETFIESRDRKILKNLTTHTQYLPHIAADYRKIIEHINIDTFDFSVQLTKKIIFNHQFLHKILEIDLSDIVKKEDRYDVITSKMTKAEKELYFNSEFQGKIISSPNELPVMMYSVGADLTALVSLYLLDLISRDISPQKCQNCGRPFFPMGKAIYCDRIFNDKFQTCKRIGATKTYDKNLLENDAMREYRKAYKRYFARVRNGLITKDEFQNWAKKVRPLVDKVGTDELSFDIFMVNLDI